MHFSSAPRSHSVAMQDHQIYCLPPPSPRTPASKLFTSTSLADAKYRHMLPSNHCYSSPPYSHPPKQNSNADVVFSLLFQGSIWKTRSSVSRYVRVITACYCLLPAVLTGLSMRSLGISDISLERFMPFNSSSL